MHGLLPILLTAVPLAYGVALVLYGRLFLAEDEAPHRPRCVLALMVAWLLLMFLLIDVAIEQRRCPLMTRGEALLFSAWMLTAFHFLNERFTQTRSLGVFTLLPAFGCVVLGVIFRDAGMGEDPGYDSALFVFHIAASLTAYVCYCIAAVMAALYVLLHRRLKTKQFDVAFRKIPPLERLDRIAAVWAFTGSIALLLGGGMGAFWMWMQPGIEVGATLAPILIVLLIFLGSAAARRLCGWRGLRHILLILTGFGALMLASVLSFLRFHGFYG